MINNIKSFLGHLVTSPFKLGMFVFISLFPFFLVLSWIFLKHHQLNKQAQKLNYLHNIATTSKSRRDFNHEHIEKLKHSNPNFLSDELKTITFLKEEISQLEVYLKHVAFCQIPVLKERYDFLTKEENKLQFVQESTNNDNLIMESEEKLSHLVELSFPDLLNLLSKIEQVQINEFSPSDSSPLMIIKQIQFKSSLSNTLLLTNLTLVKKDFKQVKP